MSFGRALRVLILLIVLLAVALDAALTRWRTTSWDTPLRLSLYPIVADGAESTRRYVAQLRREDFTEIESFLEREARGHALGTDKPLRVSLGAPIAEVPPLPPADRNIPGTAWWSLKLRAWSTRREWGQPRPKSQARIFVLYYDPDAHPVLAHSLGLQKGMIGIVHAFADRSLARTNNFVIAHELLHTLGATDKYDLRTTLPLHPHGFADPEQQPLYPQTAAEVMGGRIPRSPQRADIPRSLGEVVVGPLTAAEIGWRQP